MPEFRIELQRRQMSVKAAVIYELLMLTDFNDATGIEHDNTVRFQYGGEAVGNNCLLYTSPSPRDATLSRMPSSA